MIDTLFLFAASTPVAPEIAPTVDIFGYPHRAALAGVLISLTLLFFLCRKLNPVFRYTFWLLAFIDVLYCVTLVWLAR